jgi:RecA/RadA recombinase
MARAMIIGFTGPIGCGKSFAARHLVNNHGFTVHKMAAPLKSMMRAIGLTDEHIEGALKEVPCDLLCGKTPRHAMQTVGAEWGRDLIGGDLWVNLWRNTLPAGRVVCDDVRYSNEAAMIRAVGGLVVEVRRESVGTHCNHASERFDGVFADKVIHNSGDGRFLDAVSDLSRGR